MYYWYMGVLRRTWKCVVVCSLYDDFESGDIVYVAGTEEFDGVTIAAKLDRAGVKNAWERGFREIYSNLPDYRIKALLEDE